MCCSCQLEKLQRQKDSCVHEIKDMEDELATLSHCKQTLKDGFCMKRVMKPDSSNMFFSSRLCSGIHMF